MKLLTFSNLYPNNVDESHGIFVERRLQELVKNGGVSARVVAPVPWFPFRAAAFGSRADFARISRRETRNGIVVHHPRYPLIPKFGMSSAPWFMAAGTRATVESAIREHGGADLIDAHYFYPDGVAAARLAKRLGLPYVITARGSDINLIGRYPRPRRLMREAAENASAVIAVSEALAREMRRIGMPAKKIHVLRNGVDLEFFSPGDAQTSALTGPEFLCVGALKMAKGQDVAIRFVAELPDARLAIVGTGPDENGLRKLAEELGASRRIEFVGRLDPEALRERYRRADALILMSEREGMPNVVLESLACGTPVLASRVGGIGELVDDGDAGELTDDRSAEALIRAWQRLRERGIDRHAVRRHAERFSWRDTIAGLDRLLRECAVGNSAKQGTLSHKSH